MDFGVVVHGGVGMIARTEMTAELDAAYRATLTESLHAGHEALAAGGSAVDATVAAVRVMEDSPLFNAGRGSNFDERGVIAMDASIMDGSALAAGAVAGVTDVRNPVELARLVMDRSDHVLLIGEGAEAFARGTGCRGHGPVVFPLGPALGRSTEGEGTRQRSAQRRWRGKPSRQVGYGRSGGARSGGSPRGGDLHRRHGQQDVGAGR